MAFQSVTGPRLTQAALQLIGVKSFTRIHGAYYGHVEEQEFPPLIMIEY